MYILIDEPVEFVGKSDMIYERKRRIKDDPNFLTGTTGRMTLLFTKMGKSGRGAGVGVISDQLGTSYVCNAFRSLSGKNIRLCVCVYVCPKHNIHAGRVQRKCRA